ncbi:unnamed protein product, partial [Musa acuminata subsp. burmannicoides]
GNQSSAFTISLTPQHGTCGSFNISFSDVLPCDDMNLCIFFQVERSFDLSRVQ